VIWTLIALILVACGSAAHFFKRPDIGWGLVTAAGAVLLLAKLPISG